MISHSFFFSMSPFGSLFSSSAFDWISSICFWSLSTPSSTTVCDMFASTGAWSTCCLSLVFSWSISSIDSLTEIGSDSEPALREIHTQKHQSIVQSNGVAHLDSLDSLSETDVDELGSSDRAAMADRWSIDCSPAPPLDGIIGNGKRGATGRNFFDGFSALQNAHLNAEYSYSSCDTIPIEMRKLKVNTSIIQLKRSYLPLCPWHSLQIMPYRLLGPSPIT